MLDKDGIFLFVFSVVFALSFFVLTVEATITLQINDVRKIYPPEKPLNGSVLITFDSVLPENPNLAPSIDGYGYPQISITPYLSNISYQYKEYQFGYNITASGKNEWYESPEITFHYKISASGTCGNQACAEAGNCDCGGLCSPPSSPPYYCNWAITRQDSIQASVSASDGLKYIANGLDLISPPTNENPEDTKWSELLNNPTSPYGVYTVMRAACGNSDYMGQITEPNGWIKRSLPNEQFQPVPGTTNRKITIEPFDEKSLTTERERFVDGGCSQPYVCGGIYKDGVLMTSGFLVNGTSGEVTIYNYNPNSVYT
ncbi:MAG: hypothetical protein QW286_02250, partial [Candidatus Aenigmatarchaeota archaeon]